MTASDPHTLEFTAWLRRLRVFMGRYGLLLLGGLLLGGTLGYLKASSQPEVYASRAIYRVENGTPKMEVVFFRDGAIDQLNGSKPAQRECSGVTPVDVRCYHVMKDQAKTLIEIVVHYRRGEDCLLLEVHALATGRGLVQELAFIPAKAPMVSVNSTAGVGAVFGLGLAFFLGLFHQAHRTANRNG